jgi:hypothetical protein
LPQRGAWFEKSLDSAEVTEAGPKVSQDQPMQEGNEDDLALMDEKERKKEIVRHEREAEKTKKKKEREDEWAMEKAQKIAEKKGSGKSVKDARARDAFYSGGIEIPPTSSASPSSFPWKHNPSFIKLPSLQV